jgi:hypothetical protein
VTRLEGERERPSVRSGLAFALLASSALATVGCAGGSPLLHPARTLPAGDVRAAGGVSANVVVGSLSDDLRTARTLAERDPSGATTPGAPGTNPDYAKGALVLANVAPGLAPVVGARVGLGNAFEGGLAYTGRGVRADARRSFDDGAWSLSLGLGGTAVLYGRQQGSELPNVDLGALHGFGADVPVLGGWESDGGLYKIWFGARAGFERGVVETLSTEPKAETLATPPIRLEAMRWYGGPLLGIATGFRHVHVALEIAATYNSVNGTYNGTNATVSGLALTPATALLWTFD